MPTVLQGQPTTGFLGVNLRKDRQSLADGDVAKAINADLHVQPGAIVLRLGRSRQDTTALTDLVIRRIAYINAHRYRVSGQSVYCGTTRIINGLLSSNLITTLTPFRPLNDSTLWAFIADDAVMRKANCTTVQTWGLAVLGTITTIIGYSSTGLTGTFLGRTTAGGTTYLLDVRVAVPATSAYALTYPWEATVSPSTLLYQPFQKATRSVTGASVLVRLTQNWEASATFAGTAEDAAGRTGTALWEVSSGYVTTQTARWAYASTKADASLGAELEEDNNPPPLASYTFEYQEHLFLTRDAANPHYLWWSKRFRPEAIPTDNFLEIGTPDDPLQGGLKLGGMAGVFSRRTKYRIVGNATSGFVHQEALSRRGTPAPLAIAATEYGAAFVARDGVFLTNFVDKDTELTNALEPLFYGETINGFAPLNWTYAHCIAAASYKGRYYLAYPSGINSVPDTLAVYSADTQKWYFYDHPLSALFYEEDNDLLLGGGQDGYVYILESGTSDSGTAISLEVQTQDFLGETPDAQKLFLWIKVDADTQNEAVTVELYIDDTLKATTTITLNGRDEVLRPLPEGCLGYAWRLRFTYTGKARIRIYGAAALYAPLAVA